MAENNDNHDTGDVRHLSIAAQAENGEEDFPQEEFPLGVFEPKDQKTLKTLIRSGLPVELTVSMRSAEIPLRGGLPDPERQHRFMVTTEFFKCEPIAVREDGKIVSWKIRSTLRPVYIEAVDASEVEAA